MAYVSTSEINSLTQRNIRPTIVDQKYTSQTMIAILKHKKRLVFETGGSIMTQPVLSQINQTSQSYSGADVLNVTAQEEFTNYELPWKQVNTAINITGIDEARNAGRGQVLSIVKNKTQSAFLSHIKLLGGFVFGDGSGNSGKDWDGFLGAINNAAGFQVYLGIDRIANPWWQAQIFDPGTLTALAAGNMMTLWMSCKTDAETIDLISCTKAGYQLYWSTLISGERFVDDDIANLGFNNICFQGSPLVEDSNNPAQQMFFWNLDHTRAVVHKDKAFKFIDFVEPYNQDTLIGHWRTYGNFELRKPASCGVYRNISGG